MVFITNQPQCLGDSEMSGFVKNILNKLKSNKSVPVQQTHDQFHIDPYNKLFLMEVEKQMSNFGEEIKCENIFEYNAEDYSSHFFFVFDIDICPDWKFGVGWNCKQFEDGVLGYTFFANNKFITNKFSPLTTNLVESGRYFIDNDKKNVVYNVCELIHYIYSEKELAFCQVLKLYNYNRMYLSREDACEIYANTIESLSNEKMFVEEEVEFDKNLLNGVCSFEMHQRSDEKYTYDLLIVEDKQNIDYCKENILTIKDYLKYKLSDKDFQMAITKISDEERRREEKYDNEFFFGCSPIYKIKFVSEE